jgi:hypothetical protein
MARRITRKSMKQDEFVEAAFDAGEWLEENWRIVVIALAGVVGAVLIVLGFLSWRGARQAAAADRFAEGLALYEASPGEALGLFEEASSKAGGSLGDVADLYLGLSHLDSGNVADAGRVLQQVADGAANPVLAATARVNLAAALAASGETERAVSLYRELASAETAYYPKEMALLALGKLLIAHGRDGEAQGVLREVVDDYPQTASMTEAQTLLDGM